MHAGFINKGTKVQRIKYIFPNHTAAAAKSLQSCPTLCDPIDGRPPARERQKKA